MRHWRPLLACCVLILATVATSRPAAAGSYTIVLADGTGTASVNDQYGAESFDLDDTVDNWSWSWFTGSVTLTRTETFHYIWVHDDDQDDTTDPPVSQNLNLQGTASFTYYGTSSLCYYDGDAEGSAME